MNHLIVQVIAKNGVTESIALQQGKNIAIKAVDNVNYLVVDTQTGNSPQQLTMSRQGHDLYVKVGNDNLLILDYYQVNNSDVIGLADGTYYPYDYNLEEQINPVDTLANDQVSVQQLGQELGGEAHNTAWWETATTSETTAVTSSTGMSSMAILGTVGAIGAIGAGVALAGGGSNKSESADNTNDNPRPQPKNHAPTDISLSNNQVAENAKGAKIGKLSTTDQDKNDTHTYTVSDKRFEVTQNGELKLKQGQSLDYEKEPTIKVTVTTNDGKADYKETFTINVTDIDENHTPTDINLSKNTVTENAKGAKIGKLSTTDQDKNDTHTYTVSDKRFEVTQNGELKLKQGQSLDYETEKSVKVIVTTNDGKADFAKEFTINITDDKSDNPKPPTNKPTDISLSQNMVDEEVTGAVIGKLTTADKDKNDSHTYTLKNHTDKFEIVGDVLKVKDGVSLDFDKKSPAPDEDYPKVRMPTDYQLDIVSTDSTGKTFDKKLDVKLNNQYEGVDDFKDLPYFVQAVYNANLQTHANTPHVWGNPRDDEYFPGSKDWTDFKNIIGHGRKIVWGFGDPKRSDSYGHDDKVAYTEEQKIAVRQAMDYYAKLFNLPMEEKAVTNDNSNGKNNEFDVLFYRAGLGNDGTLGYMVAGNDPTESNNVFLNTVAYDDYNILQSGDATITLIHEIGHALGLKHTGKVDDATPSPFLSVEEDNQGNSIMSYIPSENNFAGDLEIYDRITLEYMYGLNNNYNKGDRDVYIYDKKTHYIADGAGKHDTLDLSAVTEDAYVNLTSGSWNYVGKQGTSLLDDGQFFIGYDTQIEILKSGSGNDNLVGSRKAVDYIEIDGGAGNDVINGGLAKTSTLKGGDGDDLISGGRGNNTIIGGNGDDIIFGQLGKDTLTGGAGKDTFIFDSKLGKNNIDTITDLSLGDVIQLDDEIFTSLKGKSGKDIMDYIDYDKSNGALSYDSDAGGSATAVQFASLSTGLTLDESYFVVI